MNLQEILGCQMKPYYVSHKTVEGKDHKIKSRNFGPFGQIFCFRPCGLFLQQSDGKHNKVSFDNLASSAGSYLWPATHFKSVTISTGYPVYLRMFHQVKKNPTFCMFRVPPLSLKFYTIAISHSTSDFGQLHVAQKNPWKSWTSHLIFCGGPIGTSWTSQKNFGVRGAPHLWDLGPPNKPICGGRVILP